MMGTLYGLSGREMKSSKRAYSGPGICFLFPLRLFHFVRWGQLSVEAPISEEVLK